MAKRIDRLHPTLRELQLANAAQDKKRKLAGKGKSNRVDPTIAAEKLGAKHRNYGNPITANPYDKTDPCHEAWWRGWVKRNAQLPRG